MQSLDVAFMGLLINYYGEEVKTLETAFASLAKTRI
jgi:hypothetical protein